VIRRREGFVLVALYGIYLLDQLIDVTMGGDLLNTFRVAVLVVVVPVVMVFLAWEVLSWRRKRQLQSPN
jgi:cation:H+ antiporter